MIRKLIPIVLLAPLVAVAACSSGESHSVTTSTTDMQARSNAQQANATAQQALQVAQQAQQTANDAKAEADRMGQQSLQK